MRDKEVLDIIIRDCHTAYDEFYTGDEDHSIVSYNNKEYPVLNDSYNAVKYIQTRLNVLTTLEKCLLDTSLKSNTIELNLDALTEEERELIELWTKVSKIR